MYTHTHTHSDSLLLEQKTIVAIKARRRGKDTRRREDRSWNELLFFRARVLSGLLRVVVTTGSTFTDERFSLIR